MRAPFTDTPAWLHWRENFSSRLYSLRLHSITTVVAEAPPCQLCGMNTFRRNERVFFMLHVGQYKKDGESRVFVRFSDKSTSYISYEVEGWIVAWGHRYCTRAEPDTRVPSNIIRKKFLVKLHPVLK